MSIVGKRLVMVAQLHGIDPATIWLMSLREFEDAVAKAKQRRVS